jgi:Pyruvate phosphate dikinase, AMP/ATP-binding domain
VLVLGIGVAERVGLARTYPGRKRRTGTRSRTAQAGRIWPAAATRQHRRAGARDDRHAGWVVDLRDIGRGNLTVAGGKGADLGELVRKGFPVPPGFVVTTAAYDRFVAHNRLAGAIARALRTDPDGGAATSRKPRSGPAATGGLPWAYVVRCQRLPSPR